MVRHMFLFAPATLDRMLRSMSSTGTTPLHLIHLCGRRVTLVKGSNMVLRQGLQGRVGQGGQGWVKWRRASMSHFGLRWGLKGLQVYCYTVYTTSMWSLMNTLDSLIDLTGDSICMQHKSVLVTALSKSNCISNVVYNVGEMCKIVSLFTCNFSVYLCKDHREGMTIGIRG